MQVLLVLGFYHLDKKDKIHRLIHDWFKNGRIGKPSCQEAEVCVKIISSYRWQCSLFSDP